jgi:hypothetical protein
VALSTAEAEYMAASAAVQEAVHLRELLKSVGAAQRSATSIYEDNQAAIALSKNPMVSKRTKHIDIRCHFVRERAEIGEIELVYIPTADQIADIFTKPLPFAQFAELRKKMLG